MKNKNYKNKKQITLVFKEIKKISDKGLQEMTEDCDFKKMSTKDKLLFIKCMQIMTDHPCEEKKFAKCHHNLLVNLTLESLIRKGLVNFDLKTGIVKGG